jgi:cation:H+ antiporter
MVIGANFVVKSSVNIATNLGLSSTLIGLTIVAIGTSLPELVTCIVAALKRQHDIAVGNIIGSNIFNVTSILGISSLIYPIKIASSINFDIIVMCFCTALLFLFSVRSKKITRTKGIILVLIYLSYILAKILTIRIY